MEIIDKIIYRYLANKNHPNMAVFVNDCVGLNVICHEVYEKKDLDLIFSYFDSKVFEQPCLDIGANIGNHSVYFSNIFKSVKSFEPQSTVFELLKINTKKIKNIETYNFGLSDSELKLKIYYDKENRGAGSFLHSTTRTEKEICDTNIFDNLFSDSEFSFCKIDVEGFELNVLKGMENGLKANLPIIAFEGIHGKTSEVINFLKSLGYTKFLVPSDQKINSYIISENIFLIAIRLLIRKLDFFYKRRLVDYRSDLVRDYNLILAINEKSQYKIK